MLYMLSKFKILISSKNVFFLNQSKTSQNISGGVSDIIWNYMMSNFKVWILAPNMAWNVDSNPIREDTAPTFEFSNTNKILMTLFVICRVLGTWRGGSKSVHLFCNSRSIDFSGF